MLTLAIPWIVACQAPLSMGFSRQESWSGLPFSSPEYLPDPGIKSGCPALQTDSLLTELWRKPLSMNIPVQYYIVLLLKLFQLWPLGALSDWVLCPFDAPHHFVSSCFTLFSDTAGCFRLLLYFSAAAFSSVQFSHSVMSNFVTPWTAACLASLSITTPRACSNSCALSRWCHPTISFSVIPFSSCFQSFPTSGSFSMSQFFATGGQILELQLQHQFLQWIFRVDFLYIWLVWSPCSPMDSQESSSAPQFKSVKCVRVTKLLGGISNSICQRERPEVQSSRPSFPRWPSRISSASCLSKQLLSNPYPPTPPPTSQ